jgi:outer membrane protein OmpA-like peptidoglycan-associated protein
MTGKLITICLLVLCSCQKPSVTSLPDDSDQDGLTDSVETKEMHTNPWNADTDEDGLSDRDEVLVYRTNARIADTDNDGLADGVEILEYQTNPFNDDTDNDGLADGIEYNETGTNPTLADSDNDGTPDNLDECPRIAGPADENGCPRKPKIGNVLVFSPLFFQERSAEFFEGGEESLDRLKQLLWLYSTARISLAAFTAIGETRGERALRVLKRLRTSAVARALAMRGIDPERIIIEDGLLPSPITRGSTLAERLLNRRVEVRVIDDEAWY